MPWLFAWKMLKWVKPEAATGVGMIILQILRVCTVVTLAAICASCWVLIIKVDKERAFFVFECASLFFTSIISVVLILSEFPLIKFVRTYFKQSWPVLSDRHGLAWLGTAMLMLGCNMLGNLNKPANDKDKLGPHFSKLVLASAILSITFGVLNTVCSFVWRNAKEGINARGIRSNGALAQGRRDSLPEYNDSVRSEKAQNSFISGLFRKAKKETGEKAPNMRPIISNPQPAYKNVELTAGRDDRTNTDRGVQRSPLDGRRVRPPSSEHPIHGSKTYSTADTNMM